MKRLTLKQTVQYAGLNKKRVHMLTLLFLAMIWPVATAQASVYSLSIFGKIYATNANGDTIRLNGAGSFDTVERSIEAHGAYSIENSAGDVIERGTWSATQFVDFEADGGPNDGLQGGDLALIVTMSPNNGTPQTGVPMLLSCPFENGEFDVPGCNLTIGDFLTPAGGAMVFHLAQP